MNTRTYPRTLNQAFPKTADYACAIERRRPADRAVLWACLAGVLAVAWVLFFEGAP